jgi:hypothetical protein
MRLSKPSSEANNRLVSIYPLKPKETQIRLADKAAKVIEQKSLSNGPQPNKPRLTSVRPIEPAFTTESRQNDNARKVSVAVGQRSTFKVQPRLKLGLF